MRFDSSKFPSRNFDLMIVSFFEIVDGIIGLLSFGFVCTTYEMKYLVWRSKKIAEKKARSK